MPDGCVMAGLILHMRYGVLGNGEYSIEINGQGVTPLRVRHLVDADVLLRPNAMIDDQNIEPVKALHCGSHQTLGAFRSRQIAGDGMAALGAALPGEALRLFAGFLVVEYDLGSSLGQKTDRRCANSA